VKPSDFENLKIFEAKVCIVFGSCCSHYFRSKSLRTQSPGLQHTRRITQSCGESSDSDFRYGAHSGSGMPSVFPRWNCRSQTCFENLFLKFQWNLCHRSTVRGR
jgi:hypothetical protein